MTNLRLSKFFRRFIFAERRFDFIEGRNAATPFPFCAITLLFRVNRGVRFDEKQVLLAVEIAEKDKGKTYISAFKKSYNR